MDNVVAESLKEGLFGNNTLLEFLVRFGINIIIITIIVRFIYYPRHRNKDFLFTFFLFNTVNFIICYLLSDTKLKTGFAFGLFAIFSIIRYRTVTVPIREMGYFFVAVTVGLINSLSVLEGEQSVIILLLSNFIVIGMILLLDRQLSLDHENYKEVNYERIDLIHPEKRSELIEDLKRRTGLPVHRVELIKVDFLRDVARLHAFYYSKENESTTRGMGADDE